MSVAGRKGFTLVELMVVGAIIVALLVVTMPTIRAVMVSSQQAQAENILRSALLSARNYALHARVVAGLRFQDDGRAVVVYATNTGQHHPDNFRIRVDDPFRMKSVEGVEPFMLPGQFRVMSLDYKRNNMWQTTADWWTGQQWYATTVALFSPRGRCIQGDCIFTPGWHPTMEGSFGKWLAKLDASGNASGTIYGYQGNVGIAWNGVPTAGTGPSVTTDFRLYNRGPAAGMLGNARLIASSQSGYSIYQANDALSFAMAVIETSALDFVVNVNTGKMIRKDATNNVNQ